MGVGQGEAPFQYYGFVPFMFHTSRILYPKVFLIGIKDFVEALIGLSFSRFTVLDTPPAFHPSTPLSPKNAFSAFVCIFIVLLFYRLL